MTSLQHSDLIPSLATPRFETDRLMRENARLRQQMETLKDRVEFYETTVFGDCLQIPPQWGLTRRESRLLGILLSLTMVSREAAMTAVYRDVDDRDPILIEHIVCHLRRKLKPFGIVIRNERLVGWWLVEPRRSELRRALRLTLPPWHGGEVRT